MNSVVLKTATRLISGLVLVFSIYLLWRGHHEPGGGFIAALVAATGFALAAIADGSHVVRRGLLVSPQKLMGAGISAAIGAGAVGVAVNKPYLTGAWWPPNKVLVGTPLLFDLGVFLVVLGAILTVLLALEED